MRTASSDTFLEQLVFKLSRLEIKTKTSPAQLDWAQHSGKLEIFFVPKANFNKSKDWHDRVRQIRRLKT